MNERQFFNNPEFGEIRTVEINGEPWLVGSDVAKALGYKNTKDALTTHVDEEDKKILQRSDFATIENHIPKSVFPVNFVRGDIPNRGLTIINESGVYSLVFSSKLPGAKKFKRWVTSEVLPTIRKQGAYLPPAAADKLAEGFQALADQVTALSNRVAELEQGKPRSDRFFLPEGGEEEAQYIPGPAARRRWMRTMSEKLDLLSNKYDAPHNELLHDIYMALEKRYGVVLNEERLKTMEELELTDCSMLSAIFYNPELREGIQRSIDHNLAPENRGW